MLNKNSKFISRSRKWLAVSVALLRLILWLSVRYLIESRRENISQLLRWRMSPTPGGWYCIILKTLCCWTKQSMEICYHISYLIDPIAFSGTRCDTIYLLFEHKRTFYSHKYKKKLYIFFKVSYKIYFFLLFMFCSVSLGIQHGVTGSLKHLGQIDGLLKQTIFLRNFLKLRSNSELNIQFLNIHELAFWGWWHGANILGFLPHIVHLDNPFVKKVSKSCLMSWWFFKCSTVKPSHISYQNNNFLGGWWLFPAIYYL